MARRRARRSRRATIGKWSRNVVMGLVYLVTGAALLGVAGTAASSFAGMAKITILNQTLDLGVIPSIVLGFGSVLLFMKGIRKVGVSL